MGNTMTPFKLNAIAFAISIGFCAAASAASLSPTEYKSAKETIATDFKTAESACASMKSNAKDICKAEAKGKEEVARAALEERNSPSDKHRYQLSLAKAKADYEVAKEKCDDMDGSGKTNCMQEARAAQTKATNAAKSEMKSADAGKPALVAAVPAKKETAGEYVDDSVITTKIKAAVFEDPSLKSAEINVETLKGTVQLSGFVRSRADINKAVELARKVKGVTSVKNDMIVKGQQ